MARFKLEYNQFGNTVHNPVKDLTHPQQDIFTLSELKDYLRSLGLSWGDIDYTLTYTRKVDGIYNRYHKGYDMIIKLVPPDDNISTSKMAEALNSDAYKDVKGLAYMNALHDGYSEHWNTEAPDSYESDE